MSFLWKLCIRKEKPLSTLLSSVHLPFLKSGKTKRFEKCRRKPKALWTECQCSAEQQSEWLQANFAVIDRNHWLKVFSGIFAHSLPFPRLIPWEIVHCFLQASKSFRHRTMDYQFSLVSHIHGVSMRGWLLMLLSAVFTLVEMGSDALLQTCKLEWESSIILPDYASSLCTISKICMVRETFVSIFVFQWI